MKQFILDLISKEPVSAPDLLKKIEELGLDKQKFHAIMVTGFYSGSWHVDQDMKLVPGSLWSNK